MDRVRLRKVVQVLEELPPEKLFDLSIWQTCGTAGCAVGWAASDPWFIKRGFHLVPIGIDRIGRRRYQPVFVKGLLTLSNWDAVGEFFDIDIDESLFLFSADEYTEETKEYVIERIEEFIA